MLKIIKFLFRSVLFCLRVFILLFSFVGWVILLTYVVHTTLYYPVDVPHAARETKIHPLIPNTKWNDLEPCGALFDESEEFKRALQCVNEQYWPNSKLTETIPPRCFIITTSSADIMRNARHTNGIDVKIFNISYGLVVGFYDPDAQAIYVVENVDSAQVYRHELQHHFLFQHDKHYVPTDHEEDIWYLCEPPRYSPSVKSLVYGELTN